jgi:multidrug transporter EmrE-like cation transporter
MTILLIAITSISFSVLAQFLLKSGLQGVPFEEVSSLYPLIKSWKILAGFVCYSIAAVIWLRVLADWEVSKAYPIMGLGFVVSLLVGYLNGEIVTASRIIGTATIFIGVIIVARS